MTVVLIWCATLAAYLLFAGQITWHEAATGIGLATLITAWARVIRGASQRHFRFRPEFLRVAGRGLGQLVPAALVTGGVLLRVALFGGRAGHAETHDFVLGARGEGAGPSIDRARRATAMLLASVAPDRFVVNVDSGSGTALIHAIVPGRRELDSQWLI